MRDQMKTYTADEVRRSEQPLLAAGVPLMARASAALAEETRHLLTDAGIAVESARVLVLAGSGNNGGDALFAAAQLAGDGATVSIAKTSERIHTDGLAAAMAAGATLLGVALGTTSAGEPEPEPDPDPDPESEPDAFAAQLAAVRAAARTCDVVLDGILGTGTSPDPALRGRARDLVAAVLEVFDQRGTQEISRAGAQQPTDPEELTQSSAGRPLVVAVDLPSGVGADDGAVPNPTVLTATITVTFGGCKRGLLLEPAAGYTGRVVVAEIGLGPQLGRVAGER